MMNRYELYCFEKYIANKIEANNTKTSLKRIRKIALEQDALYLCFNKRRDKYFKQTS